MENANAQRPVQVVDPGQHQAPIRLVFSLRRVTLLETTTVNVVAPTEERARQFVQLRMAPNNFWTDPQASPCESCSEMRSFQEERIVSVDVRRNA